VGWGSFASSVVVADLGAGSVDLAPEDPAGLVQAVVQGPQAVGEEGDDVGDGAQDSPVGKGFRFLVRVGAGPFPRCAPSAGSSLVSPL
jgi:hypothetical protein